MDITAEAHPTATSIPDVAHETTRRRATYSSFGKNGLTATANAYGHLMHIARYFGNAPSGFFCVDLPGAPPPYDVTSRMKKLQGFCEDSCQGMRLHLKNGNENEWKAKIKPGIQFYHDCWPRFVTQDQAFKSEIQCFISGTTVYQTYTFDPEFISGFSQLIFSVNLLIRDLDFVKPSSWNDPADLNYSHGISTRKDYVFIMHKGCAIAQQNQEAVVLFISPFIDGRPQPVAHIQNTDYQICPDAQTSKDISKKRVKITLAYTLELVSPNGVRDRGRIPFADLVLDMQGLSFETPSFTNDRHLDFTLRRNLEHILSVCSIPIQTSGSADDEILPIALTCGDISGHRIAKAASFYAFQFLLKAFEYFDENVKSHFEGHSHDMLLDDSCENYVCRMRSRILKTCRGHLKWISNNMQTKSTSNNRDREEDTFGPHYWASGQIIDGWEDNPVFPEGEITDAPLQIIKFGDFCRITKESNVKYNPPTGLQNIAKAWAKSLDEQNKRGVYAFPRLRQEATAKFYLADHALIWWSLKSLEELGLDSGLDSQTDNGPNTFGQHTMEYSSEETKTNIIKRFTMNNPVLDKRMIAISRSSAETRFSILMRETVLFYAMDLGLFDTETPEASNEAEVWENKADVWTSTVDYQAEQEDQQDAYWNHPLQFALSIIMASKKKRIGSRSAAQMYKYSRSVLLRSSSSNGLFPGQLDRNKKPVLFDREVSCDAYWQATFEVPYILWKYQMSPSIEEQTSNRSTDTLSSFTLETTSPDIGTMDNIFKHLNSMSALLESSINKGHSVMGDRVLLNSVIDQGKIVQIPDEWLYNELDCFKKGNELSEAVIEAFCKDYERKTHMIVINNAVRILNEESTGQPQDIMLGYIIDIPKKKDKEPKVAKPEPIIKSSGSFYDSISVRRTPESAKKRLIHFSHATEKTALICYIAASQQPEISDFFNRHAAYSKYFREETNAVLNQWATELHLSFYQLMPQKPRFGIVGIPTFDQIDFPRINKEEVDNFGWISRAVMSFRFDGDFFDRHWTCHFFEFNPYNVYTKHIWDIHIQRETITGSLKTDPWRQRRVLELVLFGRMLREMVEHSQVVLREIKRRILDGLVGEKTEGQSSTFLDSFDLFTDITSDKYSATSKMWNKYQYILETVEEDICDNLTKIELWTAREERREKNKPRWTINDERNYGGAISRLQKSNNLLVQDLRLCYARVITFNKSLTRRLESTRGEWEVRSNDDIRLFTYVTVVFLPISFATSIFSMNGTPTKQVLGSMATTAAVAILATVLALLNAKMVDKRIARPAFHGSKSLYAACTQCLANLHTSPSSLARRLLYNFWRYIYLPLRRIWLHPTSRRINVTESHLIELESLGYDRYGPDRYEPVESARRDFEAARSRNDERQRRTSIHHPQLD